jgi:hypothetical protein
MPGAPIQLERMAKLLSLVPYILAIVILIGAIVEFSKDSDKYKNSRLKTTALVVLFLGSILSLISLYQDNREKENSRQEIKRLEGKADEANDAQRDSTKLFINSFNALHQEVSDLQTQVKTDALQKKADALQKKLTSVQDDLEATQKALAPGPKATLAFTFWPFNNPPLPQRVALSTDARFPKNDDGSYHIEFTVVNLTDVDALEGEFTLMICDLCKFAKEPLGFSKLPGQKDTERYQKFDRILPVTALAVMTADVTAPDIPVFNVGIQYRCRTCVISREASLGRVLTNTSVQSQMPKP